MVYIYATKICESSFCGSACVNQSPGVMRHLSIFRWFLLQYKSCKAMIQNTIILDVLSNSLVPRSTAKLKTTPVSSVRSQKAGGDASYLHRFTHQTPLPLYVCANLIYILTRFKSTLAVIIAQVCRRKCWSLPVPEAGLWAGEAQRHPGKTPKASSNIQTASQHKHTHWERANAWICAYNKSLDW